MNRMILVGGLIAIAFFLFGSCSKDSSNCIQCPPCEPGKLNPIKVLIVASEVVQSRMDTIIAYSIEKELFPEGSSFKTVFLIDSIPPLDVLTRFDAILLYTVEVLEYPDENDSIGDIMADYIDSGGGIVLCQGAMRGYAIGIGGRLRAPGYSPFLPGSHGGIFDDRKIELSSISFPLHPIFYGIDILNITSPGLWSLPHPILDELAILLAKDQFEANAISINSNGNIIGLNIWPSFVFSSYDRYPEAARLIANSLMFVAGSSQ